MTIGEKIKEARKQAGLTQAQMAEKLNVSRQAITKWEADAGLPDIENIKRISHLLSVSIDYLLDDSGQIHKIIFREAIDLNMYDGKRKKVKKDRVVREKYPDAEIYTLIAKQRALTSEKIVDHAVGIFTAAASGIPLLGIPEVLDSLKSLDKEFYLAVRPGKQFLVLVSDEFVESRELVKAMPTETNSRFEIGETEFRNCGKILYA